MKIAYFLPHPIQYQSPLLRHLVDAGIDLEVIYHSRAGADEYFDEGFARRLVWDVPLLDDYPFQVLPPVSSFLPMVRACIAALCSVSAEVVWIHGWGDRLSQAAWLSAKLMGLPVMLRGEASLPCVKGGWLRRYIHRVVIGTWFRTIDHFLAIGTSNLGFYRSYGVPLGKISWTPYTVDNEFFASHCSSAEGSKEALRASLGISMEQQVVLFAGRLIPEKNVNTLLDAWELLAEDADKTPPPMLLVAGDGPMRCAVETRVQRSLSPYVRILGFLNQSKLPAYYNLCDALVLPSHFEPWGVVVNEAMNAGKAVILSDKVGAGADLVREGWNGWTFASTSARQLASCVRNLLDSRQLSEQAGQRSREIIKAWSFDVVTSGLNDALRAISSPLSPHTPPCQEPHRPAVHSSATTGGVFLASWSSHEMPQMALAAHEMGVLQEYFCTLYKGPGKWGSRLSRLRPVASVDGLSGSLVPPNLVIEYPWPMVARQLGNRLIPRLAQDTLVTTSDWFAKAASRRITSLRPQIVVGAESCALHLFHAAKDHGIPRVLDCHGIPVHFLESTLQAAADELGLACGSTGESPVMRAIKEQELDLADVIVTASTLQRELLIAGGTLASKIHAVPLWVDSTFWHPPAKHRSHNSGLKVLFAGAGSLAKGLPYLLTAVASFKSGIELTIVGSLSQEMVPLLERHHINAKVVPFASKSRLREYYWSHDLLVMPSLGDSFGFVILEAMACGLPVICTTHCGAPVPCDRWRIAVRSSSAIQERLQFYLDHRDHLSIDGKMARDFSMQHSPEHYRSAIRRVYQQLLSPAVGPADSPSKPSSL